LILKLNELDHNFNDVLFVIVLYNNSLENSITIESITANYKHPIDLLAFDNSPRRQYQKSRFQYKNLNVFYSNDEANPGLSRAYNYSLLEASKLSKKWILLLDQDTLFTEDYIKELYSINTDNLGPDVVAIIPKVNSIYNPHKIISPAKMYIGGKFKPINLESGVSFKPISAINSGSLINVDFLKSINGFKNSFQLDMLDHWYFREIYKAQKQVYVLNSTIYQSLSVSEKFEDNISIERYRKMLNAEKMFISLNGRMHVFFFKLRLLARLFKQIKYQNKAYFKSTFQYLFQ